jgi:dihydrofolate reductase
MSGVPRSRIVLVAAVARNGVIGRDGGMPWRLPTDLKLFRRLTMGKPVVMGRRTFEAIGKPLDGRINIVVTRDTGFGAEGILVAHGLDDAIVIAEEAQQADAVTEIMVIGGGTVYSEMMDRADRICLTRVEAEPEGDTVFPAIDPAEWIRVRDEPLPKGERDTADVRFQVFERREPRP